MFNILPERKKDAPQIEALLDQVFGETRHTKASYAFRRPAPPIPDLCLVARDGEYIVGTLRFWPVKIGSPAIPALLLGPIGVSPDRQKQGIGRALIARGHLLGQFLGYKIVLLVGDVNYYCRFGYSPASAQGITMANEAPERLLVHELRAGSLNGVSGDILACDGTQPDGKVVTGAVA